MKTEIEQLRKEFNERIDALLKEDKPKFEVGKWYKLNGENFMKYLVDHLSENNNMGYGLNRYGEWSNNDFGLSGCVPATPEEVEAALVKEAEKRGFKEGVTLNSAHYGTPIICQKSGSTYYHESINALMYMSSYVFKDGQWATIIKDDVIKVGSYKVKFHPDKDVNTTIDGNIFTKQFWQAAKLISEHSKAKVMVGCLKQFDVSLEVINKILDKL